MPEPHEEIKIVREVLKANSGDLVVKAELKGRWLEEHPDGKENDYYNYLKADSYNSSLESLKRNFDTNLERVRGEEKLTNDAALVDKNNLKLSYEREFFAGDRDAQIAYANLRECFKDDVLYELPGEENFYKFDTKDVLEFRNLLLDAKAGAQRNATESAAELGAAMSSNDVALRDTELFESLEGLKTALKEWDELLVSDALPDKAKLTKKAKECGNCLEYCYKVHGKTFGKETNVFVKYQLLATMRALGEKVAAQFAARAGKPSFASMCELIRDVPNRGSNGKQPGKEFGNDLGKALRVELDRLEHELAKADKGLATELKATFDKTPYRVSDALINWRDSYNDPSKLTNNVGPLRDAIAKIAFGVGKYKSITDSVLQKSNLAKVKAIRDSYQQTFDGFASRLQNDIQLCVKTLGS